MPLEGSILVCFAVGTEASPFRPAARRLGVEIIVTGMGRSNAQRGIETALKRGRPAAVITAGFAGGLNPQFSRGSVIYETTDAMLGRTLASVSALKPVRFHCADTVATTPAQKRELHEATGADAVEMESHAIEKVCASAGIPCATVRVISDAADESLPMDFNRLMNRNQQLSPLKLAGALLRSPRLIGELMRFNTRLKPCAVNLASALRGVVESLRASR